MDETKKTRRHATKDEIMYIMQQWNAKTVTELAAHLKGSREWIFGIVSLLRKKGVKLAKKKAETPYSVAGMRKASPYDEAITQLKIELEAPEKTT